jgi:hypothetical protein
MKNLRPYLLMLLALVGLVLVRCNKNNDVKPEDVPQNGAARVGTVAGDGTGVVIGPYTVTFVGVEYSENPDQSKWTYTIERTGEAEGNGLSHWTIGLGNCVGFGNVIAASIDGESWMTKIQNAEGNGTGCAVPAGATILKFDNLPNNLSTGVHTFSFTLNVAVDMTATAATWVKPGNNCFNGTIPGPGCYSVTGKVTKEDCLNGVLTPSDYSGLAVALSGTSTANTITGSDGTYKFENLASGNYTITIAPAAGTYASVEPGLSQSANINTSSLSGIDFKVLTYTGTCSPETGAGCSLSMGYWFAKPNLVWPGTVTIGGKIYTQAEGKAIWNTSNAGGMRDAKMAFLQVAAIKLSGSSVALNATVWADVAIAEAYLSTIPKLTPSTIPKNSSASKAAGEAGGRIGKWIDDNHCTE